MREVCIFICYFWQPYQQNNMKLKSQDIYIKKKTYNGGFYTYIDNVFATASLRGEVLCPFPWIWLDVGVCL